MRTLLKYWLVMLGLMVACVLAPNAARATIAGTSHDLSGTAPGGQLCVACHAPHHVPGSPLIWNHVLSANNFSWSDATETTGGTTLPTNIKTWSGTSKNCLSCHDGTVEIGKIYTPGVTFDSTKITGPAQIATLTGDLKGNHPVAVPYPYNQVANTYNAITTGGGVTTTEYTAVPAKVKVYTDPLGGANNHGIECASCHDAHGTIFPDFLRDALTGSAICLDCHIK